MSNTDVTSQHLPLQLSEPAALFDIVERAFCASWASTYAVGNCRSPSHPQLAQMTRGNKSLKMGVVLSCRLVFTQIRQLSCVSST